MIISPSQPAWTVLDALLAGKDLAASVEALGVAAFDETELAREILSAPFLRVELDHPMRTT